MSIFHIKISSIMTSFAILTQCVQCMDMDVEQPKEKSKAALKRNQEVTPKQNILSPSAILKTQQNTIKQTQNQSPTSESQHPYSTRQQMKMKKEMLDEQDYKPSYLATTYQAELAERYRRQQEKNQPLYKGKEIKLAPKQAIISKTNSLNQERVIFVEPNTPTQSYLHPMPQTNSTLHILDNHDNKTPFIHLNGQTNQPHNMPKTSQQRPTDKNHANFKKQKIESSHSQKPIIREGERADKKNIYKGFSSANYNYQGITFVNYLAANYTPSYHLPIGYNYPINSLPTSIPIQLPTIDPINTKIAISTEKPSIIDNIPQPIQEKRTELDDEETIYELINLILKNKLNDSINILDEYMTNGEFFNLSSPKILDFEIKEHKVNNKKILEFLVNKKFNYQMDINSKIEENEDKINTDRILVSFLKNLKHIKLLSLDNIRITDNSLYCNSFAANIEHIEIKNCSQITDICVGNILTSNPNLKYLSIQKCPNIRPDWTGIFTKHDLYELKMNHNNFTNNSKLFVEKNDFEILKSIATRTIQDMDNSLHNENVIQQSSPTLSIEEISYLKSYPFNITLSKYIPEYDKIKHLNQNDFANNFLMNIVNTFSNTQKIVLSNTEASLTCLFHLFKLTNLTYLNVTHTSLKLKTRIFDSKTSIDKLFHELNQNIYREDVRNSYIDSFFHTT